VRRARNDEADGAEQLTYADESQESHGKGRLLRHDRCRHHQLRAAAQQEEEGKQDLDYPECDVQRSAGSLRHRVLPERGQWIVDIASGIALFLVPTGLYLWWDLHNVIGLYTSFTVVILAATGLLIAFETPLNWMARSAPWRPEAMPRSSPRGSQGSAPVLDVFMQAARRALPDSKIYQVQLPMRQRSPLQILMHGPALAGHSTVYLDRYTAHVLRVDDFRKLPRAYRAHVINQAIHMSTILGPSSEILLSVSSLMLVVLAVTGCMMWWQRSM
jgi:uncharacterized iron-regulated membrane protein